MFEKILPFTRKRHVVGLKCAFTGHRPQNLPFRFDETDERCLRLKAELRKLIVQMIEQKNVTYFISGMALGIDTYAAEMVLDLKTDFPFITLECALPCETQAAKWSERYRNRYFKIVEQCDKETLLQTHYTPDCMQKRNRYMVEHADFVLAVWDGSPGGTGMTVNYAHTLNKVVWTLNPNTFSINFG